MKQRRQRYRLRELDAMPTRELRRVLGELGLSTAGALEKGDLVKRLVASGKVRV